MKYLSEKHAVGRLLYNENQLCFLLGVSLKYQLQIYILINLKVRALVLQLSLFFVFLTIAEQCASLVLQLL